MNPLSHLLQLLFFIIASSQIENKWSEGERESPSSFHNFKAPRKEEVTSWNVKETFTQEFS